MTRQRTAAFGILLRNSTFGADHNSPRRRENKRRRFASELAFQCEDMARRVREQRRPTAAAPWSGARDGFTGDCVRHEITAQPDQIPGDDSRRPY
jgi:hypothetical protein